MLILFGFCNYFDDAKSHNFYNLMLYVVNYMRNDDNDRQNRNTDKHRCRVSGTECAFVG